MNHEPDKNGLPGFFGRGNRLFGWVHAGTGPIVRTPVVVCSPVGYEQVRTYNTIRVLAETLAEDGHTVLRFDYPGTGDSQDLDNDCHHVNAWLDSIREAITQVNGNSPTQDVTLIGIRLGGALASAVAESRAVRELVLWEPSESGRIFCREMQIIAAANQCRDQANDSGNNIDAGGFLINAETQASLNAITLGKNPLQGAPRILLLERDDLRRNDRRANAVGKHNSDVQRKPAAGYKQMMLAPQESVLPTATIATITSWLGEQASAGDKPSGLLPLAAATKLGAGISERALRFGPDERLFGVLTRASGDEPRRTVITLGGGAVPHYSANRMYVPLARRLAEQGYDVLRISLSGIGDSRPAPGGPINTAYTTTTSDDIRSAMSCITELTGNTEFSLFGLCSGAFSAMQVARTSQQVSDIILLNQLVYFVSDDEFDKLANGVIKSGHSLDFPRSETLMSRLLLKALKLSGTFGAPLGHLLQQQLIGGKLTQKLHQIAANDVRIAFVHSENDPAQYALRLPANRAVQRLLRSGQATIFTVPDTDHTFSPAASQRFLIDWVVAYLNDRLGAHK